MKLTSISIAVALAAFGISFGATDAQAAGEYRCKGKTSFGQMGFKVKNGRVRGQSFSLQNKVLEDGAVRLSYQGEFAILGVDGIVRGRGGAKTGGHNCDLAKFRAALKK